MLVVEFVMARASVMDRLGVVAILCGGFQAPFSAGGYGASLRDVRREVEVFGEGWE